MRMIEAFPDDHVRNSFVLFAVISTHEDPIPAWCNVSSLLRIIQQLCNLDGSFLIFLSVFPQNIYGLNGMLVACGLGFLRIMVFDRDLKGDVVCADFVTNSTLAAIWDRYNEL